MRDREKVIWIGVIGSLIFLNYSISSSSTTGVGSLTMGAHSSPSPHSKSADKSSLTSSDHSELGDLRSRNKKKKQKRAAELDEDQPDGDETSPLEHNGGEKKKKNGDGYGNPPTSSAAAVTTWEHQPWTAWEIAMKRVRIKKTANSNIEEKEGESNKKSSKSTTPQRPPPTFDWMCPAMQKKFSAFLSRPGPLREQMALIWAYASSAGGHAAEVDFSGPQATLPLLAARLDSLTTVDVKEKDDVAESIKWAHAQYLELCGLRDSPVLSESDGAEDTALRLQTLKYSTQSTTLDSREGYSTLVVGTVAGAKVIADDIVSGQINIRNFLIVIDSRKRNKWQELESKLTDWRVELLVEGDVGVGIFRNPRSSPKLLVPEVTQGEIRQHQLESLPERMKKARGQDKEGQLPDIEERELAPIEPLTKKTKEQPPKLNPDLGDIDHRRTAVDPEAPLQRKKMVKKIVPAPGADQDEGVVGDDHQQRKPEATRPEDGPEPFDPNSPNIRAKFLGGKGKKVSLEELHAEYGRLTRVVKRSRKDRHQASVAMIAQDSIRYIEDLIQEVAAAEEEKAKQQKNGGAVEAVPEGHQGPDQQEDPPQDEVDKKDRLHDTPNEVTHPDEILEKEEYKEKMQERARLGGRKTFVNPRDEARQADLERRRAVAASAQERAEKLLPHEADPQKAMHDAEKAHEEMLDGDAVKERRAWDEKMRKKKQNYLKDTAGRVSPGGGGGFGTEGREVINEEEDDLRHHKRSEGIKNRGRGGMGAARQNAAVKRGVNALEDMEHPTQAQADKEAQNALDRRQHLVIDKEGNEAPEPRAKFAAGRSAGNAVARNRPGYRRELMSFGDQPPLKLGTVVQQGIKSVEPCEAALAGCKSCSLAVFCPSFSSSSAVSKNKLSEGATAISNALFAASTAWEKSYAGILPVAAAFATGSEVAVAGCYSTLTLVAAAASGIGSPTAVSPPQLFMSHPTPQHCPLLAELTSLLQKSTSSSGGSTAEVAEALGKQIISAASKEKTSSSSAKAVAVVGFPAAGGMAIKASTSILIAPVSLLNFPKYGVISLLEQEAEADGAAAGGTEPLHLIVLGENIERWDRKNSLPRDKKWAKITLVTSVDLGVGMTVYQIPRGKQ